MKIELRWVTPNALEEIEWAARLCYDSHDKIKEGSAAKLVRACVNKGHHSITEHASASFYVSGVTRALMMQMRCHRHLSFCVRSQRYCKEKPFTYTIPKNLSELAAIKFETVMVDVQAYYNMLLDLGAKAEDARGVLPNACHTEFVVTGNFRAWAEVIPKRTDRAAQNDIQELFGLIQDALQKECPEVFGQIGDAR